MGHYDEQYEADERDYSARKRAEVKAKSEKTGLNILHGTKFWPQGLCAKCGDTVYVVPNWGCNKDLCPHKP